MWRLLIWVLAGAACVYVIRMDIVEKNDREAARCQAAQQTILDEAALIAAGGKFPREDITDRWKKLLRGC